MMYLDSFIFTLAFLYLLSIGIYRVDWLIGVGVSLIGVDCERDEMIR